MSTTLITNDPLGFSDLLMATVYGDIRWVSTECVVVSEKVVCMYFYITRDQTISWTRNRPESSKKIWVGHVALLFRSTFYTLRPCICELFWHCASFDINENRIVEFLVNRYYIYMGAVTHTKQGYALQFDNLLINSNKIDQPMVNLRKFSGQPLVIFRKS